MQVALASVCNSPGSSGSAGAACANSTICCCVISSGITAMHRRRISRHFSHFYSYRIPTLWATYCKSSSRQPSLPVSSHAYSTELKPDPALRRIVVLAGLFTACIGVAMILLMPIRWPWRVLAAIAWLATSTHDLVVIRKGYRQCRRIRIQHDGGVLLLSPQGCWFPATIVSGSIVLRGAAWLRFEDDNGQRFAELIRRKRPHFEAWRRLQVIWRHLGAGR